MFVWVHVCLCMDACLTERALEESDFDNGCEHITLIAIKYILAWVFDWDADVRPRYDREK
jgi:hypothetical protein